MPGHPQPEAEGAKRSGRRSRWGTGPRPGSGEAQQADVYRDGAATLCPCDAVDGKQKQQCGGAQTSGGVSQLPLAVAARHGEESDGHALQVTSLVCECVNVCRTLLKTSVAALQDSHPWANLLPWQPWQREIGVVSTCCGSGICCSSYLDGVLVVGLVVSLTTVYLTCLYDFMFFTGCFIDIFLVLSEIEQVCTRATWIVTQ